MSKGIPHIYELKAEELLSILPHLYDFELPKMYDSSNPKITFQQKYDGSNITFGCKEGKPYIQYKIGSPIFDVNDIPEECWTKQFRLAQPVLFDISSLIYSKLNYDFHISAEIIYGTLPNVISYDYLKSNTIMTYAFSNKAVEKFFRSLLPLKCSYNGSFYHSDDGCDIKETNEITKWDLLNVPAGPHLYNINGNIFLYEFLTTISKFDGLLIKDVIDISLNKRPESFTVEKWKSLKPDIKLERERLTNKKNLMLKEIFQHYLSSTKFEGYIIKYNHDGLEKVTKIVNESFRKRNHISHLVKYWLAGGRRPSRPSFLSRTKDWDIDTRLARLDVLLERFKKYHHLITVDGMTPYTHPELYERTLFLFADVRKRIKNGR